MRLRSILLCSYVFLALLAVLAGSIGIQVTRDIHDEFEFVREDLLPVSDVLEELRLTGITIASAVVEYEMVSALGLPPADGAAVAQKKIADATALFIETLIRYERMVWSIFPEEEGFLAEVRTQGALLQAASLSFMDMLRNRPDAEVLLHGYQLLQKRQAEFGLAIDKAIAHEKVELVESKEKIHEILEKGEVLEQGAAATIFAFALAVGLFLSGWLSKPLAELKNVAEAFGRGNFQARAAIRRGGEIGALAQAFNAMAADLQDSNAQIVAGQRYLKNILQSVPDGLLVTDAQSRVVLMNPAAELLLDIPFAAAQEQPLAAVLQTERIQNGSCLAKSVGQKELLVSSRSAGETRTVQVNVTALDSETEPRGGSIVVLRDVSSDRQVARMKTQFIATAAHELSTPLTSIMGYASLLHEEGAYGDFTVEQKKAFIAEVHDNAEYLHELTNKLLDLDRMESGRAIPLSLQTGPLKIQVDKVLNRYRKLYPSYRFEAEYSAAAERSIQFDPMRVNQVLENLVSNAVKYSNAGSSVRISVAEVEGGLQVSVQDEGIGMTAEQQIRAFDPFYRVNDADTAPRGTGLGLCIVKNIVETHGGQIAIDSEPGRGTQVHFILPPDGPAAAT